MLLLLYGPETYLARIRLQELKKEAAVQGALISETDCKEDDLKKVLQGLNISSLFNGKKFLVFHNPFHAKEWEEKEIQNILLKNHGHTLVFIEKEPRKTSALFKFIARHGNIEEFLKLKGAKLKSWAAGEIQKQESSFAPGALEALLFFCGDDLERLSQEIQKLTAFRCFASQKQVTKDDVVFLVAKELEPKIFSTIDAIAARDRKLAMKLLAEHLQTGESPLQLLSMFAWQLRILLSQKDLMERGMTVQEIAQKLKLHPFAFQKSFAAVQHFSLNELKELYKKVFSLDLAFKTGRGNPDQLLHLFVASAATKEKQRS